MDILITVMKSPVSVTALTILVVTTVRCVRMGFMVMLSLVLQKIVSNALAL